MKTKYICLLSILIVLTSGIATAIPETEKEVKTLDDKFLDVTAKVPGFGGMFIEGDVLEVYLLDTSQKSSVQAAIAQVFGKERAKNIKILQGKYSFSQLKEWESLTGGLFEMKEVIYTDVDEKQNRLKIGVDDSNFEKVEKEIDKLGIPRDVVIIEKTDPIVQTQTLQDRIRPIQGGLQIAFSNYLCSEGFNGIRAETNGFVTASHCTNKQGGVENTQYYQPSTVSIDNFIGTEIADPTYSRQLCRTNRITGKSCRYSDSAFSNLATGVLSDLGSIERPVDINSIMIAGSFNITSEGISIVNDTVNKVGRTTGWTQGRVSATCVNVGNILRSNVALLCQDFVDANVGGGDSGSPVFSITNTENDVQLRGVLWGGNLAGTYFIYSPIEYVQSELGPITTHI